MSEPRTPSEGPIQEPKQDQAQEARAGEAPVTWRSGPPADWLELVRQAAPQLLDALTEHVRAEAPDEGFAVPGELALPPAPEPSRATQVWARGAPREVTPSPPDLAGPADLAVPGMHEDRLASELVVPPSPVRVEAQAPAVPPVAAAATTTAPLVRSGTTAPRQSEVEPPMTPPVASPSVATLALAPPSDRSIDALPTPIPEIGQPSAAPDTDLVLLDLPAPHGEPFPIPATSRPATRADGLRLGHQVRRSTPALAYPSARPGRQAGALTFEGSLPDTRYSHGWPSLDVHVGGEERSVPADHWPSLPSQGLEPPADPAAIAREQQRWHRLLDEQREL